MADKVMLWKLLEGMPVISDDVAKRVSEAVDNQFESQLERTAELVSFPSTRGSEDLAQRFVEREFRDLGLYVDRWSIDSPELREHPGSGVSTVDYGKMMNVVGTYHPEEELGKSVILNGHIDVVPVGPEGGWSRAPWEAQVQDGWMYGRGVGDMKAGLMANLSAFSAVRSAGLELTGRVHLQSVVEEECTGNGSLAALLRGYSADAVIIPEPEDDALVRANVGVLWFTCCVSGYPAHPREMANGFNAIDSAYEVMAALRTLEARWNAERGEHPYFEDLERPINFNFGGISGGDWPSSVPAWCELRVRVATYPGIAADVAWREIVECAEQAASRGAFEVQLVPDGFFADGYVLEPGSDAENLLNETHRASYGRDLTSFTTPGYLDGRVFVNYGNMPTLVYGPVAENIHGFDERVNLDSVRKCTKSIALFLVSWCGVRYQTAL